jgi:hypothetical protein
MQVMRFPNSEKIHDRTATHPNGVLSQDIVLYVCMIGHREQLQVAWFNLLAATGIVKILHPSRIVTTCRCEQAKLRSLLTGEVKHVPHNRPQFRTCRCRPQKSCAPGNNMSFFHKGNGITKNSQFGPIYHVFPQKSVHKRHADCPNLQSPRTTICFWSGFSSVLLIDSYVSRQKSSNIRAIY